MLSCPVVLDRRAYLSQEGGWWEWRGAHFALGLKRPVHRFLSDCLPTVLATYRLEQGSVVYHRPDLNQPTVREVSLSTPAFVATHLHIVKTKQNSESVQGPDGSLCKLQA